MEDIPLVLFDDCLILWCVLVLYPLRESREALSITDFTANLAGLLWSWWRGILALWRLGLGFRVVPVHQRLVTSDNGVHEVRVAACEIQHVLWDLNTKLLCSTVSIFGTNFAATINHLRSPYRPLQYQAVQKAQKVAGKLRLPVPTWPEPPSGPP